MQCSEDQRRPRPRKHRSHTKNPMHFIQTLLGHSTTLQIRRLPDAHQNDPHGDARRAALLEERPTAHELDRTRLPDHQMLESERRRASPREWPRILKRGVHEMRQHAESVQQGRDAHGCASLHARCALFRRRCPIRVVPREDAHVA